MINKAPYNHYRASAYNAQYFTHQTAKSVQGIMRKLITKGQNFASIFADPWIEPRLRKIFAREKEDNILESKFERWLMIVDESGDVIILLN